MNFPIFNTCKSAVSFQIGYFLKKKCYNIISDVRNFTYVNQTIELSIVYTGCLS
jgi:hypothetical protein